MAEHVTIGNSMFYNARPHAEEVVRLARDKAKSQDNKAPKEPKKVDK